ncbi:hypothetical protein KKA47_05455 [bacterium]|nr:hypothetical protein [bacterium]
MIANYDYQGKPIKQHAKEFFTSRLFKDGMKDIKLMVGDLFSTVGEEIKDGITKEDQKQLKEVIDKELKKEK